MVNLKSTEVPAEGRQDAPALWAHMAPFVAWIVLMSLFKTPSGINYAVRTFVCLALLLYLRPWRWYDAARLRDLPLAVLVGVAVFVVWILPELAWFKDTAWSSLYARIGILPPWNIWEPPASTPYAPGTCGVWLTAVRLFGSMAVIAVIEEYFWRGFLYRWMLASRFPGVPLGRLSWPILLLVSLAFGLEHRRWIVGFIAGLAFGLLMIRTRNIHAACLAHGTTNALLGVYVLATGSYEFW